MNKKGQGLPLTTIVVAILVIIVLVLVVTFFLGGFAGLTSKVKEIFFGTTAGTSLTLATQNCKTYCEQASLLPETMQPKSAYCTRLQKVDMSGDGEADSDMACEKDLGVNCPEIKCQAETKE